MEYQFEGGTVSTSSRSWSISKNRIFSMELCLWRYLLCTSAKHPARICYRLLRFAAESALHLTLPSSSCLFTLVDLCIEHLFIRLIGTGNHMCWTGLPLTKPVKMSRTHYSAWGHSISRRSASLANSDFACPPSAFLAELASTAV